MRDIVKLRNELKSKKPSFLRQDAHKVKRLPKKWKKPKGLDSKMRRRLLGYRTLVKVGYGSPRKAKGLTKDGLKELIVRNADDLKNVKENNILVISSTLGLRKKVSLLKEIKKLNLKVANLEDIDSFIKQTEEIFSKKKEASRKKEEKKKKAKEESLKKSGQKKEEKPLDEEEAKKEQARKAIPKKETKSIQR